MSRGTRFQARYTSIAEIGGTLAKQTVSAKRWMWRSRTSEVRAGTEGASSAREQLAGFGAGILNLGKAHGTEAQEGCFWRTLKCWSGANRRNRRRVSRQEEIGKGTEISLPEQNGVTRSRTP